MAAEEDSAGRGGGRGGGDFGRARGRMWFSLDSRWDTVKLDPYMVTIKYHLSALSRALLGSSLARVTGRSPTRYGPLFHQHHHGYPSDVQ